MIIHAPGNTSTMNLRQIGDPLADEVFINLKSDPSLYQKILAIKDNEELRLFGFEGALGVLVHETIQLSFDSQSGSSFFEQHANDILFVLGMYSLPYCYAGAKGARVLATSKRIKEQPGHRLAETAQFVMDVCRTGAFDPKGRGYLSAMIIRLRHAAARYYASRFIDDEVPINQEDSLATMLAFSLIVIRGLRALGHEVTTIEAESYYDLWKYLGQLMGIQKGFIPKDLKAASLAERGIRKREFEGSLEGRELTASLIQYYEGLMPARSLVGASQMVAWFLGMEISAMLGLRHDPLRSGLAPFALAAKSWRDGKVGFSTLAKRIDLELKAHAKTTS